MPIERALGNRKRFGAIAWVLLGLLLMATSAPIEVIAPIPGETRTWMPVVIAIEFDQNADIPSFQVLLNGNDISGEFSLSPASGGRIAATSGPVWGGFVGLGANQIDTSIDLLGSSENASRSFDTVGDPYADDVVSYQIGDNGGFNSGSLPGVVTGAPDGGGLFLGGLDVVSLGRTGRIELAFDDNVIVDGPGDDFTVFENAFLEIGAGGISDPPFAEPARISISQDGVSWTSFACTLTLGNGPYWPGCAGIYPAFADGTTATPHPSLPTSVPIEALVGVSIFTIEAPSGSGGDSFDLADVGLSWARYVKIESADFDVSVVGTGNSGFDLDAVAAVNSSPTIPGAPLPSLHALGFALLIAALALGGIGGLARADDPPPVSAANTAEDARFPPASLADRLFEIRLRVQRARSYPPIARRRGVEGETRVTFEIGFDGVPFDIATVASSGSGALDRAAQLAVERAGVLPWVYGRVTVPVRFSLRDPD